MTDEELDGAKVEIKWTIDDGCAGKDRPHYTTLDVDEFDGLTSNEEIINCIFDAIQHDFETTIGYGPSSDDLGAAIERIKLASKGASTDEC